MTPVMTAVWPHLNDWDTKHNRDGELHVKLEGDMSDPQVKALVDSLDAMIDKACLKEDHTGERHIAWPIENGKVQIKLKQKCMPFHKGANPIQFFDAKGTPLDKVPSIFNGSKLQVAFHSDPAVTQGVMYPSLRPEAVQIVELSKGGQTAEQFGFGEIDGYTAESFTDFVEDDDEF